MSERFKGKTAMIAGGTGGLGRAVALAFLREGAAVHVTYRSEEEFSAVKHAEGDAGAALHGHRVDVTHDPQMADLFRTIGRLDILVNAVGAYTGGAPLWQTHIAVFGEMMSLNVQSGFVLLRNAVPAMLAHGSGAIVNVSSRAAVDHAAGASAYAASKAAAVAMTDSLAADLKGTGVRANTVLPSIIDTQANRNAMPDADYSKWPKPDEIAAVILFLCSDEAKLIHGAAVPVYGNN
jgi:NAD(P)-dependent dehydrogenase (short-subunit alcohol dehydrogenase family)